MRRLRWFAVALAAACLVPAPAWAASSTLVAEPTHGPAGQAATFTYHYSGRRACENGLVMLLWEGSQIGSGRMNASCAARITATPPAGATAGPHQVFAWSMNGAASITYGIDAPPSPSASPTPSPDPGPPSPSPPPPSPSPPPPPPSPTPTPTKPKPSPTPSDSPSVEPTPSEPTPVDPGPTGPCDPGDRPDVSAGGQLSGSLFAEPVAVQALDPSRVRPVGVDFTGDPQIRITLDTLPDPSPVRAAIADGQPLDCLRVDLAAGDGFLWASYAFRDVLLSAYESGTPTSVLSFSYGGVAWRYALTSGTVVTGDSTSPPKPIGNAPISWVIPATGAVLIVIGGCVWSWLRRTRHAGTRRA